MIDREPFVAPGGTLFLIGRSDVLLTTLDGREATVPLTDLVALFPLILAASAQLPAEETTASRPRLIKGRPT